MATNSPLEPALFLIDVMATVRRVPVSGISHFNDLLAKLTQMTSAYHSYGRCDYIFDLYSDNPSVKDSERLRRCNEMPVILSTIEPTTPFPRDLVQHSGHQTETICFWRSWYTITFINTHNNFMSILQCLASCPLLAITGNVLRFKVMKTSVWSTFSPL